MNSDFLLSSYTPHSSHTKEGRERERKGECNAIEESKIDGKRRDIARESKRARQHERVYLTLPTPPQRSRIRPMKEPNLSLLWLSLRQKTRAPNNNNNPSCKMPARHV